MIYSSEAVFDPINVLICKTSELNCMFFYMTAFGHMQYLNSYGQTVKLFPLKVSGPLLNQDLGLGLGLGFRN